MMSTSLKKINIMRTRLSWSTITIEDDDQTKKIYSHDEDAAWRNHAKFTIWVKKNVSREKIKKDY